MAATESFWRTAPATLKVMTALGGAGREARFVGGCVRNSLLGVPVSDIDIATIHRSEQVMERCQAAGLLVVPTGLSHGTVTVVVNGQHFEVTTLRRDVETDGRHAVVDFTNEWAVDASRRDFTLNAIYMDIDGSIDDPVGGIPDLRAGRVRFIGDPDTRIDEDALRILRFFRIHACYGRGPLDREGLAACRRQAGNVAGLAGERIRVELLRLIIAPGAGAVVEAMQQADILLPLFPEVIDSAAFRRLIKIEGGTADPLRRLSALLPAPALQIARRLRMSRQQRTRLVHMEHDRVNPCAKEQAMRVQLYRLGTDRFIDAVMLDWARSDRNPAAFRQALRLAETWDPPAFPLRGADLRNLGLPQGHRVGDLLRHIEERWLAADFAGDREACLAWAREQIERYDRE